MMFAPPQMPTFLSPAAASSDIEISDVTLPMALLIASVFEEFDGSRIELIVRRLAARKSKEARDAQWRVGARPKPGSECATSRFT
jgi:hypothetical protein